MKEFCKCFLQVLCEREKKKTLQHFVLSQYPTPGVTLPECLSGKIKTTEVEQTALQQ